MARLTYGEKVCIYDQHGKLRARGNIVGRTSHVFTEPQEVAVMPDGSNSWKDAIWVGIGSVRRYQPVDESPKHVMDEV